MDVRRFIWRSQNLNQADNALASGVAGRPARKASRRGSRPAHARLLSLGNPQACAAPSAPPPSTVRAARGSASRKSAPPDGPLATDNDPPCTRAISEEI